MYNIENPIYEIGLIMEHYLEMKKVETIGHHVYEISLILSECKKEGAA